MVLDIDPSGDLILKCGEYDIDGVERYLRVSSHVLSLASPVFKAMFNLRFPEGRGMDASRTSGKAYSIALPDDAVNSMRILLGLLHFTHSDELKSPEELLELATVCDKYDCSKAMKFITPTLFMPVMKEMSKHRVILSKDSLETSLLASYLLGNADIFAEISKHVIWHYAGTYATLAKKEHFLPLTAMMLMQDKRSAMRDKIEKDLFARLAQLQKTDAHHSEQQFDKCGPVLSAFMKLLMKHELAPFPARESLSRILVRLQAFWQEFSRVYKYGINCVAVTEALEPRYRPWIENYATGICLFCVRGNIHDPTKQCHTEESE